MHKISPDYNALATHTAGGGIGNIGEINDDGPFQTTGGASPGGASGMSGEGTGSDGTPMSYGYTSVVAKGTGMGTGQGKGAQTIMGFMGGNRSFPQMQSLFDPRHRLMNLIKDASEGAVAMHGLKEWGQQFLNCEKGMFMTGNMERKMRFALTENKTNQKQQQQQGGGGGGGGGSAATREGGGGGGGGDGGGGGEGGGSDLGQKSVHKEESKCWFEQDKDKWACQSEDGYQTISKDKVIGYHKKEDKSYRSDANHTHIEHTTSNSIFTDAGGCWSTQPIQLKSDSCGSGSAYAFNPYDGVYSFDERTWQGMSPFTDGTSVIDQLKVVQVGANIVQTLRGSPVTLRSPVVGMVPQQVANVFPAAVTAGNGKLGDEEFVQRYIDYTRLIPVMVQAMQAMQARINTLEQDRMRVGPR